jgi:hypothetical protein
VVLVDPNMTYQFEQTLTNRLAFAQPLLSAARRAPMALNGWGSRQEGKHDEST